MKTITIIVAVIFLIMIIFVAAYLIAEYGKKQSDLAAEYDRKYAKIKKALDEFEINESNYDWLLKMLERLGELKYKNRERTEVLTMSFFRKYKHIAKKRVKENA